MDRADSFCTPGTMIQVASLHLPYSLVYRVLGGPGGRPGILQRGPAAQGVRSLFRFGSPFNKPCSYSQVVTEKKKYSFQKQVL